MKKLYLIALLLFVGLYVQAQVLRISTTPLNIGSQVPGYSQVTTINTKTIAYVPLPIPTSPIPIDEDSTAEIDKVYHYADVITTNITMADGNFTNTSVGKVWTIRISVPNALNIGFSFNQFNLDSSSEMYIFNESRTLLDSAIKKSNFTYSTSVGIAPFRGNSIIIYIVEPGNFSTFQSIVSIEELEAGFQEIGDMSEGVPGMYRPQNSMSIGCDPTIQCSPAKLFSARAVSLFWSNGHQGTGTLINNENNDGRAYFLTAFHVIDVGGFIIQGHNFPNGTIDADELAALSHCIFQFQFWKTSCNGTTINFGLQFSGAILRAASRESDVVLLELLNPPGINDGVNYAGWNRQTSAPSDNGSFIIHHPEGRDMRITSTKNVKSWFWNSSYWTAHYYSGTVTHGSSGAALFNENNQIVGQLRSGWSSCDFTDFGDRYGKFSTSWGGANLQQWLSPVQNLENIGTLNLSAIAIEGNEAVSCTGQSQYSVPDILDANYQWEVTSNLNIVSGQGTSSIMITKNGSTKVGFVTVTVSTPTKGARFPRSVTISKQIVVGTPTIYGTYTDHNGQHYLQYWTGNPSSYNLACNNYTVHTNMDIQGADNVTWSRVSANPSSLSWGENINNINFYFWQPNQTSVFKVVATNSCGTSTNTFGFKSIDCSGGGGGGGGCLQFAISPNPSQGLLNVVVPNIPAPCDVTLSTTGEKSSVQPKHSITQINIYDNTGSLKKSFSLNHAKQATVNLSGLVSGVYYVEIKDGTYSEKQKVVLQK